MTKNENKQLQIVIDGTVGVGKSTLMTILQNGGFTPFPEPVFDNPLLDKFYANKKRYSFPLQVFFLNKRFEHIKKMSKINMAVGDRSIYGDQIFAQMLRDSGDMTIEEYNIYKELLDNMLQHCQHPTLMIYLQISVDEAVRRIQKRGRDFELGVERDYWDDLNERYGKFFKEYNYSPVLTIDVSDLDFENNAEHRQLVIDRINQKLKSLGHNVTL